MNKIRLKDGTWIDTAVGIARRIMSQKRVLAAHPNDETVQGPEHFAMLERVRKEVAQYDADAIVVAASRIAGNEGGRPKTAEEDHDQWLLMLETEIAADERAGTKREADVIRQKIANDWAEITKKNPRSVRTIEDGIAEARARQAKNISSPRP